MAKMLDCLQHRGPDDSGIETFRSSHGLGPSVLGFRRLSIQDLSTAGHQPMANEDGMIWTIFNGEIYNHHEIRAELEALGHEFRSKSDTEVIVHGYEQWGIECVKQFNGMFAFAILDQKSGRVVLVRDRLGIKPLYYCVENGRLFFASEAKALLESPDIARRLDKNSLEDYLTLGYVPGRRTMFKNIFRLEAGHTLVFDGEKIEIQQYWSVPPHTPTNNTESELTEEFRQLLIDSVKLQLESDVPLGAFLSGGLDSSSIVAIMARELKVGQLKTFCVGYENRESRHDERAQAEDLAEWLGTTHQSTVCTERDAVAGLPNLVWHLDEPIAEDVMPAYLKLCRSARKEVTVALTGEGSDEFGYGYRYYGLERFRRRARWTPSPIRAVVSAVKSRLFQPGSLKGRALDYCLRESELDAFMSWWTLFCPAQKKRLIGGEGESPQNSVNIREQLKVDAAGRTERGLDLIAWIEASNRLVDYVLLRSDRLSMAAGLETRVPFLDHRVVEFMSKVPSQVKIQGWTGKLLLRRAVKDFLPSENTGRKKKPFGAPVAEWLASAIDSYLLDSRLVADGVLTQSGVDEVVQCRIADPRRYDEQGWALVMLEVWYRVFIRQDLKVERKPVFSTLGN